jgi:outer membrane protein assembly factor BamB
MSRDKPCNIKIRGSVYKVATNGILLIKQTGKKDAEVQIVLPDNFYIDAVQYQINNKNILFIFGITDDESGSTIIVLFDPTNNRLLWSTEIYAFNPSPLLVSQGYIYVGGIGMVAKLKLSDGKIIWQHKDLYERETGAFNSFIMPLREGNIIIFKEAKVSDKYNGIREVRIDDTTGAIISK